MPSTPAKRRRERSASATSNSSTNSFPDLATLLNTPIKPKPKPKPEASPGKFQKRTFHPISHTQCLTSYLQDCVLGQAYQPSPGMEARIKSFAKEIADDMSDCISEVCYGAKLVNWADSKPGFGDKLQRGCCYAIGYHQHGNSGHDYCGEGNHQLHY